MALEYEVRAEYQSMSLDQLLDAPVMCFEGVGDTQNDILNKYFSITTVRQLANMPYFLWALGIQEMALKGGEPSTTPVSSLSQSEALKFSVTPHAQGKDAVELLNSSVNVLDGLTPGQNLALYDSFRVTNVVQLAHNRIMLEARVIEYLEKHPELVDAGEGPDKDEVASILGTDTRIATSGDEAQGLLTGDAATDGLRTMAGEIGDHVRSRIDALKDRAAERAKDLASSTDMPSGDEITEGIESRRMATGSSTSRDDALRSIRARTEATRVQSVTSDTSDRMAALEAARGAAGETETTEGAASGTQDSGSSEGAASGTQDSGSSEGAAPGTGDAAAGEEAGAAAAGGASEEYSTAPGMTVRPRGDEETSAEEGGEEATPQDAEEEDAPAEGFSFKPWMAAAAAALVVLIGLIVWLIPGGKETAEPTSSVAEGGAQGTDTGQGTGTGQGTDTGQGTGSSATADSQTSAVAATTPPDPGPPIRTIHTVVKGESLWRISRRQYQNPLLWPQIYRANEDQIEDPDLIFPDQNLKIPEPQ